MQSEVVRSRRDGYRTATNETNRTETRNYTCNRAYYSVFQRYSIPVFFNAEVKENYLTYKHFFQVGKYQRGKMAALSREELIMLVKMEREQRAEQDEVARKEKDELKKKLDFLLEKLKDQDDQKR